MGLKEDVNVAFEMLDGRVLSPEEAQREGVRGPGWVCPHDGWVNFDIRSKCRFCGVSKPSSETPSSQS